MNKLASTSTPGVASVLIEQMHDPVCLLDLGGRVVEANRAFLAVAGEARPLILHVDFLDFLQGDARAQLAAFLADGASVGAREMLLAARFPRQDNTCEVSLKPLLSEDGSLLGYIARVLTDGQSGQRDLLDSLRKRDERYRIALRSAQLAIWDTWDAEKDHYVSGTWFDIRRLDPEKCPSDVVENWQDYIHPDDLPGVQKTIARQERGETNEVDYTYRTQGQSGEWQWIRSRGRILTRDAEGRPERVIGTDANITEQKLREAAYQNLATQLGLAVKAAGIGTWRFFQERQEVFWDNRILEIYAITDGRNTRPAAEWEEYLHPDDKAQIFAYMDKCLGEGTRVRLEYRIFRADGELRHIRSIADYIPEESGGPGLIGVNIDITEDVLKSQELEAARAAMERESRLDALTGLANRRRLDEVLDEVKEGAAGDGADPFSLLHVDVDHFKSINDTHGHAAGDAVLCHVARALSSVADADDLVVRAGGDEFLIVVRRKVSAAELNAMALRAKTRAAEPLEQHGKRIDVGLSIGIARQDEQTTDPTTILRHADLALYAAKDAGRNCARLYEAEMGKVTLPSRDARDHLLRALEDGSIFCHFQPQILAATGKVVGVEALARWRQPSGELMLPEAFLPGAERDGLLNKLDRHVLNEVLCARAGWVSAGLDPPPVSINLTANSLADPTLSQTLARAGVTPGILRFELLETAFLDDRSEAVQRNLQASRDLGIEIEIDDFGSGHASVVSFLMLDPHRIKIDEKLIDPIVGSEDQRQVVEALVAIARLRGTGVIAEGICTPEHARIAAELGCDTLQGYAVARPMSAGDFADWLATYSPDQRTPPDQ